ncbi:hypothetical protein ON010_g12573 [Phytophthora cinnamomi]|nr:hypothetical protein ON010_g12573 [Phytophthora cinnamomi]
MCESVIDFARVTKPLQEKLDEALATATIRTKRVASGIALNLGGSGRQAFDELKGKLQNASTLAFPEPDAVMCLITDASDVGYGLIVTQIRSWQAKKPVAEQQYKLLVCVSGTFIDSKRNWSVIEKVAYPIICGLETTVTLLRCTQWCYASGGVGRKIGPSVLSASADEGRKIGPRMPEASVEEGSRQDPVDSAWALRTR